MADKTSFKIKEECQLDEHESWSDQLIPAPDCGLKKEVKVESECPLETDNSFQDVDWHVTTERTEISGMEFPHESDSPHMNWPPLLIKEEIDSDREAFHCGRCPSRFYAQESLENHMSSHDIDDDTRTHRSSSLKPHKCNICYKGFASKFSVTCHMSIHKADRHYECLICHKRFMYKFNLTHHMNSHSSARPHKCDVCGKAYKREGHLTHHMLSHESVVRDLECPATCQDRFMGKHSLKLHMRSHCTLKPDKALKNKLCLSRNMTSRDTESECPETCRDRILSKRTLQSRKISVVHLNRHKCKICNKLFRKENALRCHMWSHNGRKTLNA